MTTCEFRACIAPDCEINTIHLSRYYDLAYMMRKCLVNRNAYFIITSRYSILTDNYLVTTASTDHYRVMHIVMMKNKQYVNIVMNLV